MLRVAGRFARIIVRAAASSAVGVNKLQLVSRRVRRRLCHAGRHPVCHGQQDTGWTQLFRPYESPGVKVVTQLLPQNTTAARQSHSQQHKLGNAAEAIVEKVEREICIREFNQECKSGVHCDLV